MIRTSCCTKSNGYVPEAFHEPYCDDLLKVCTHTHAHTHAQAHACMHEMDDVLQGGLGSVGGFCRWGHSHSIGILTQEWVSSHCCASVTYRLWINLNASVGCFTLSARNRRNQTTQKYLVRKQQFLTLYTTCSNATQGSEWCNSQAWKGLADGMGCLGADLMSEQIMWCSVGSWDWPAGSTWITVWGCDGKVGSWAAVSYTSAGREAGDSDSPFSGPLLLRGHRQSLREAAAPVSASRRSLFGAFGKPGGSVAVEGGGCWKPFVNRSRDLGWAAWFYMPSREVKGSARCSRWSPAPILVCSSCDVFFWCAVSGVFPFSFVIARQVFLLDPIKVNWF
jgi:hypothetical protein